MNFSHVLYHANCADGFAAAYAAWKYLGQQANYLAVRHGDPPPELASQARVVILDFSYDRDTLLALKTKVADLVVLDHHKSAHAALEGLEWAYFDLNKSGARLAWEFWHPQAALPALLAYVEDRDLWRWLLPESREVSLALQCYPQDFKLWDQLVVEELAGEGRAILKYQDQLIARACSRAQMQPVGDYLVPVVNSCLLQSEIGEKLCQQYPDAAFSAVYYVNQEGKQAWSLRSVGGFDVALVAQSFGGGGHRNAAGFGK